MANGMPTAHTGCVLRVPSSVHGCAAKLCTRLDVSSVDLGSLRAVHVSAYHSINQRVYGASAPQAHLLLPPMLRASRLTCSISRRCRIFSRYRAADVRLRGGRFVRAEPVRRRLPLRLDDEPLRPADADAGFSDFCAACRTPFIRSLGRSAARVFASSITVFACRAKKSLFASAYMPAPAAGRRTNLAAALTPPRFRRPRPAAASATFDNRSATSIT